jgi:acyl-CoA synthetase (AMP-forming)/AMP-acid ligase II
VSEIELLSTIPAMIADVVARRGGEDAVVMPDESVTFAELDARSARMARALLAAGAGKGARIALLAPDGIFWVTAFLAGLRIGALMTCVSTMATPRELAHILANSDTQFVISARRMLRHDYGDVLARAFPELAGQQAGRLQLSDAPFLRAVWFDDPQGCGWAGSHADLLAMADNVDATLLTAAQGHVSPSDEAVIVYTSGSTSLPKAVIHTQWNITRHPPELAKLFLVKPGDRMLPMLPAFWLGGMAMAMQCLTQGATLVYPHSPEHDAMIAAIRQCRVNRLNGWGDGLVRLRERAVSEGMDVDAIVGLGPFRDQSGELIPPHLQSNMLGMSETFAPHSAEPINVRLPEDKAGASGRAINNYERRVVNPETGAEVAAGEVGELQLRGGALMTGFYGKRACEVFTPDGFYPTGDLVRIDEDGYLFFVARRNDMIKTRAANVSRLEVEAALNALPEVAMCAVTGLIDAAFGQVVAAAVVLADGAQGDAEALRTVLRETLSSYKVPKRFVFVAEEEIPRTSTGKLRLGELPGLFG